MDRGELFRGVHICRDMTKSITLGILMACPQDERAPRIDWIEERRREKEM